jgi:hypothetical protein
LAPTCFASPGFVALSVLSGLLAVALFALALLFASVFFESNALSRGLEARAHGRVGVVMLALQTALVLIARTFAARIALAVVVGVVGVVGLVWVAAHLFFWPYYAHIMNELSLAAAMLYVWTSICLALNNFYVGTDASLTALVGAPFAVLAGVWLADWRAASIFARAPLQLPWLLQRQRRQRLGLLPIGFDLKHDALRQGPPRDGSKETQRDDCVSHGSVPSPTVNRVRKECATSR